MLWPGWERIYGLKRTEETEWCTLKKKLNLQFEILCKSNAGFFTISLGWRHRWRWRLVSLLKATIQERLYIFMELPLKAVAANFNLGKKNSFHFKMQRFVKLCLKILALCNIKVGLHLHFMLQIYLTHASVVLCKQSFKRGPFESRLRLQFNWIRNLEFNVLKIFFVKFSSQKFLAQKDFLLFLFLFFFFSQRDEDL